MTIRGCASLSWSKLHEALKIGDCILTWITSFFAKCPIFKATGLLGFLGFFRCQKKKKDTCSTKICGISGQPQGPAWVVSSRKNGIPAYCTYCTYCTCLLVNKKSLGRYMPYLDIFCMILRKERNIPSCKCDDFHPREKSPPKITSRTHRYVGCMVWVLHASMWIQPVFGGEIIVSTQPWKSIHRQPNKHPFR